MCKYILTIILLVNVCFAQQLTYENAAAATLENNLGIKTVKNQTIIAKNNNTVGNAGMLPDVNFNASGTYANNTTNQDYSSGLTVNKSGVVSNGINSGIVLSWTIFDGMRMFAAKGRLNETELASEFQLKHEIENTLMQVSQAYYELVKQKQQITAIDENIKVYEERLRIAQLRLDIGKAPKTDLLLAKVDLNTQKAQLINSQTLYRNTQVQLNQLMGKPVETEIDVATDINFSYAPGYNELKTSFAKKNNSILLAEKNVNLAGYMAKEVEAMRYPKLAVNTSYNFTRSTNQAGFVLLNQNLGLNAGFSLTWNLFSGFKTNTLIKNAKINYISAQLVMDNVKRQTETALFQAWQKFDSAKKVLAIEEETYALAKENMDLSLERFKLGDMTTVEFKQTQISLQDVQTRLVNARYDAKLAETELMLLNGDLVK